MFSTVLVAASLSRPLVVKIIKMSVSALFLPLCLTIKSPLLPNKILKWLGCFTLPPSRWIHQHIFPLHLFFLPSMLRQKLNSGCSRIKRFFKQVILRNVRTRLNFQQLYLEIVILNLSLPLHVSTQSIGGQAIGVDISNAFDKVRHSVLQSKLLSFELNFALEWLLTSQADAYQSLLIHRILILCR